MLTPDTPARRASAGPLRNARLLLAFGLAFMFGSHLSAFWALAQTDDLIVIKNADGQMTARLTYEGYWGLGNAFHPNAGTISLAAGRKYWSVKSATGVILFAIDCESGEAWSAGPANEGLSSIDPAGSTFSAKSADGTTVFSVSPDGEANAAGSIWGFFVQNCKEPTTMIDELPEDNTYESIEAETNRLYGGQNMTPHSRLVPAPEAQLRIRGWGDVTCKKWRTPFIAVGKDDPSPYGMDLGFRYRFNNVVSDVVWFSDTGWGRPSEYGMGREFDMQLHSDENGVYHITEEIADYCVDVTHPIEWPYLPTPGMYQFSMDMTDDPDYLFPLAPIGGPGTAQDSLAFHPQTALFAYAIQFFPPAKIPRGRPDDKPVWLGCQLYPGNTPGTHSMTVKIYDSSSIVQGVPTRWREWTNTDYWVMAKWDGILYRNGDETQPFYSESDIFMEGTVTFDTDDYGNPIEEESNYLTDTVSGPGLAISLSGMAWAEKVGLELEVGTPFTAVELQQNLGFTPNDFKWDFKKKVFKDIDKTTSGKYEITDLLGDSSGIVNVEHPVGRYITGAKSSAPNTDFGPVTASLTASDSENHSARASLDFELVVNAAKITFYYTPYEWQYSNYEDPETTVSVMNSAGQTTTIYTIKSFVDQAEMEGNGRMYRIRTTAAEMHFTSGTVPTADQKYIWRNGNHWEFSSIAKNSMNQQLTVGTAARFEVPVGTSGGPHYSYYNWSPSTYVVHDLKQEIDMGLAECLRLANTYEGPYPYRYTAKPFSSSTVTIKDTGPFDHVKEDVTKKHNPRDLGHLDIYLEEADSEYGISKSAFDTITDAEVEWGGDQGGRKVTKNDNQ